jgi:hypothetical protein
MADPAKILSLREFLFAPHEAMCSVLAAMARRRFPFHGVGSYDHIGYIQATVALL